MAALCAAIGFATGSPAYIAIDLICVIGATVAVVNGTSQQRRSNAEQKRVAREAKEAARRAAPVTTDTGGFSWLVTVLALVGLGLMILAGTAVSRHPAPNATALAAAPEPQPVAVPPTPLGTPQVTASPTTKAREVTERDADERWEKMLAEEDAELKRRYDELNQTLPPSFERRMADCGRRTDEIEAWVCRDRFIARLRKHGIEVSQAAIDGLMWPESAQPAPTQAPATPGSAEVSAGSPQSTVLTPDTRQTPHTGQPLGGGVFYERATDGTRKICQTIGENTFCSWR